MVIAGGVVVAVGSGVEVADGSWVCVLVLEAVAVGWVMITASGLGVGVTTTRITSVGPQAVRMSKNKVNIVQERNVLINCLILADFFRLFMSSILPQF